MSLDEQDDVANEITRLFKHSGDQWIHDLRSTPHSGYRAVHVWLRLAGRVEVQVRTHLQSAWANAYEAVADFMGREIRYDSLPIDVPSRQVVTSMRDISTGQIVEIELARNDANRLRREYAEQLRGLADYGDEDTLPHHLVNTQEADARISELMKLGSEREMALQNALTTVKAMFNSLSKGGS